MKNFEKAFLISMVLGASLSRLLPHWPNMTVLGALALFSGTVIQPRWVSLALPLLVLFVTDMVIGFHSTMFWTYGAFALVTLFAQMYSVAKKGEVSWHRVPFFALVSSGIFFLVSNFGVWMSGELFPPTPAGLVACYIAALPFALNQFLGDLLYTSLLFGLWAYLARRVFRSSFSSRFI